MFNSLLNKLAADRDYWNHEKDVYKRIADNDSSNEEAILLFDACLVLSMHCENLIQEIQEMMEEKYTMLYLMCKKFKDDKGDFTIAFSTNYRVLVEGEENQGKRLQWFNVYFRCDTVQGSGWIKCKRKDIIIPSKYKVEQLPNGKFKKPYITILNYEEFYEDEDNEN